MVANKLLAEAIPEIKEERQLAEKVWDQLFNNYRDELDAEIMHLCTMIMQTHSYLEGIEWDCVTKCIQCTHYEQTGNGKQGSAWGRCKIKNTRTDVAGGRPGTCRACKKFEL